MVQHPESMDLNLERATHVRSNYVEPGNAKHGLGFLYALSAAVVLDSPFRLSKNALNPKALKPSRGPIIVNALP